MDTLLREFSGSIDGFRFDHNQDSFCSNQILDFNNLNSSTFVPNNSSFPSEGSTSSGSGSDGESPSEERDSYTMLKFISEILMEEDLENKTCMLHDCLALQAAEKSFYDVLVQNDESPGSSTSHSLNHESTSSSSSANNLVQSNWRSSHGNVGDFNTQTPLIDTIISRGLAPMSGGNSMDPGNFFVQASMEMNERQGAINGSSAKKSHQRDGSQSDDDERCNKQSVVYVDDSDQSELFDKVLLCKPEDSPSVEPDEASRKVQDNGTSRGSRGRKSRGKKRGNANKFVDLSTILTQCAQAVANNDHRTANDLLKQIRQYSSSTGDGTQRLAYYFAEGLEARLGGTGMPYYSPLVSNKVSMADILKAYMVFIQSCPFRKMSNVYANRIILKQAENAKRIHIIDFGIAYGFQWPCFIQRISRRPGGPPSIRITGIELPQPGFRPAERVEETGRRLENYCKRFKVPFKYNVIAKRWENITLEDLKIDRDEMTFVNCLLRMKNLPDETAVLESPRDAVLKLIRKINPDLFVHGIVNGTYNAPFFVTRFREALFHFSALFDMIDTTINRNLHERTLFEKEIYARDAINSIACEGLARVERPETYKQWQARNQRAGLRQIPLDQKLLKKVKSLTRHGYHDDFLVDQDGEWMLQGWKGRIFNALSCWKSA